MEHSIYYDTLSTTKKTKDRWGYGFPESGLQIYVIWTVEDHGCPNGIAWLTENLD